MIYKKYILIIFTFITMIPFYVSAISIEVENKDTNVQQGDVVIFDVYLNSQDEINSVEGSIQIEGDYTIKTITTAGSIFDMWPNKPSFQDGKISFTGGSVSSVFGNRLKLFSVVVQVDSSEKIIFSSNQIDAFLNNGIGTKISVDSFEKEMMFVESDGEQVDMFNSIVLNDQNPPLNFDVIIGKDENTYDGKYFASFNASDKESGIDRYEIIENDIKTPILTGTTYILQDQSLKGTLIVKAIDKAGNTQIVQVKVKDVVSEDTSIDWRSVSIAIFILLIVFIVTKKIKIKNVLK